MLFKVLTEYLIYYEQVNIGDFLLSRFLYHLEWAYPVRLEHVQVQAVYFHPAKGTPIMNRF